MGWKSHGKDLATFFFLIISRKLTNQIDITVPKANVPDSRAVCRIHDILVWIRIRGSMPLTKGSDPYPDPAIFVIDLQDANKKLIKKSFPAYYS